MRHDYRKHKHEYTHIQTFENKHTDKHQHYTYKSNKACRNYYTNIYTLVQRSRHTDKITETYKHEYTYI